MAASTRKTFLADLANLAASFRARIEAEVTGFDPDPAECQKRRKQAHADFGYFVGTYFPHYVRSPHRSRLHDYLFTRLPEIVASDKSETDAIAAPRGEAKSTLVSQLFVLWCLVTGRKRYPVIVMDSIDQAYPMLEAIKAELEFNPRLQMDFPEVTGQGRVWQAGTIVTKNDAKVQVAGSGKKLRGLRHGPYRPDLAVLDDIENDEQVRNPDQRDKLQSWVSKTILPLGGAGAKFDVVYIGTILHYDSVLNRTLANKLWRSAKFKALLKWPDRMDLWERWEERLRNDGEDAADAFYQEHRVAMEAGSECSWAARPLLALMKIRARDGHDTFDSEYQNDPVAGDNAPFAKVIQFWVNRLADWIFYGACDPSLGKAGASRDPSALLVGGFNRSTGILDVVEAGIKKRLPDRIIEDVIAYQAEYHCLLWVIETVQFQAFLYSELVKRAAARGIPVPARGVQPITDKLLRIESLQPHMANGLIRLHPSQTTLIDQLRHFPKADHDDGPDALQMLWMAATTGMGSIGGFQSVSRHGSGGAIDDFSGYDSRRMF
ncbi:phage terminase large subunit [Aromatoleum toluclasticum]|uniref:phage terminase large subunit n=1 Tax=Aromatoleum toluclasticum TaxID=92003 RepID=UPI001D1809AD|nr:phage terminase large subunit [Aromatoleum toluclasticum]MCC4116360.1 phage terminase large subunit [Aromatoleum toluclasticum]